MNKREIRLILDDDKQVCGIITQLPVPSLNLISQITLHTGLRPSSELSARWRRGVFCNQNFSERFKDNASAPECGAFFFAYDDKQ